MPPPLQMKACHWILSRLSTLYRMAITDSLDFQVAPVSLLTPQAREARFWECGSPSPQQ